MCLVNIRSMWWGMCLVYIGYVVGICGYVFGKYKEYVVGYVFGV